MWPLNSQIIVLLNMASYLLGLLLIFAGAAKLCNLPSFRSTLAAVGRFPNWFRKAAAWCIPVGEVTVGAGMLFGASLAKAAGALMLLAFFIFSVDALRQKIHVSCRCFGGGSDTPLSKRTAARALGLAAFAGMTLAVNSKPAKFRDVTYCLMASGICLILLQLAHNTARIRKLKRLRYL